MYPWRLHFFGLTPQHKPQIHDQIFQLVYYGQGFTHADVYNMPIYLRSYYFKKLVDVKEQENQEVEKAQARSRAKRR